jgi:hypothetical protein
MKIFLNDFMVYNDIESHLMKLKLCFQKCKEYRKFSDLMIVFQKMHLVCVSMVLAKFLYCQYAFLFNHLRSKGCFFGILPNMKKEITTLPKDDIVDKWCLV